jgi:hypothetical protein
MWREVEKILEKSNLAFGYLRNWLIFRRSQALLAEGQSGAVESRDWGMNGSVFAVF